MADDILGHDNLDHGRHIKHHGPKPRPGERFGRGTKPRHIGLRREKRAHYHAPEEGIGKTAPTAHQHNREEERGGLKGFWNNKKKWILGGLAALLLLILSYRLFTAAAFAFTIIVLNAFIEQHKYFTAGTPIDLEILFVGSAYAASVHGLGWGLFIAVAGVIAADASRGHFHGDTSGIKIFAVLVTAAAASVLSATPAEMVFAILLGCLTQYLGLSLMGKTNGFMSIIRRFTTFGFNAYLAIFVVPLLLKI